MASPVAFQNCFQSIQRRGRHQLEHRFSSRWHPGQVQNRLHHVFQRKVVQCRPLTSTAASSDASLPDPQTTGAELQQEAKHANFSPNIFAGLAVAIAASLVLQVAVPRSLLPSLAGQVPRQNHAEVVRLIGCTLCPQAASLWALKSATANNRLQSDTYKRLLTGLVLWSASFLAVTLLHAKALSNIFWLQAAIAAVTLVVCGQTALKLRITPPDPGRLLREFLKRNKTGFAWWFDIVSINSPFIGGAYIAHPFASFLPTKWMPEATPLGSYLARSYGCSIIFATFVFWTLRDGENRGRSSASTFRLLAGSALAATLLRVAVFYAGGLPFQTAGQVIWATVLARFLQKRRK